MSREPDDGLPAAFDDAKKLLRQAAAEPLREGERHRNWRAIEDGLSPRRAWGKWLGGGALSLAAAAALFFLLRPPPDSQSAFTAQVVRRQNAEVEGGSDSLEVGQTLRTQAAGRVEIASGAHRLVAMEDTVLSLVETSLNDDAAEHQRWSLERGVVLVSVDPTMSTRFWVDTPHGQVQVLGTVFRVEATAASVEVSVLRGQVAVRRETRVEISAGESATVSSTGDVSREPMPRETREVLADAFGLPQPEEEEGDSTEVAPVPAEPEPTEPEPTEPTEPTEAAERERGEAGAEPALDEGECARAASLAGQNAGIWMRVAECYARSGDDAEALAVYRRVSTQHRETADGQTAAFEVGRIARRLGQRRAAREAFQEYLRRYPRGSLAAEAQFRVCTLQRRVACYRRFRQRFPQDDRVDDSYRLEADLSRSLGNCEDAIRSYNAYLRVGDQGLEEARQWRDWCQAQQATDEP